MLLNYSHFLVVWGWGAVVVIPASVRLEDSSFDEDDLSRDTLEDVVGKRSRLRSSFVATHLLPTLSTVSRPDG